MHGGRKPVARSTPAKLGGVDRSVATVPETATSLQPVDERADGRASRRRIGLDGFHSSALPVLRLLRVLPVVSVLDGPAGGRLEMLAWAAGDRPAPQVLGGILRRRRIERPCPSWPP